MKSLHCQNSRLGHWILILGWPKLDMLDLTDSNVDFLKYLSERIRFGT